MRLPRAILGVAFVACATPEPDSSPVEVEHLAPEDLVEGDFFGWRFSMEKDGLLLFWQPEGGEVPRNKEFEARVIVARVQERKPLRDMRVVVRGWMPDHQHGLVKEPQVTVREDGLIRVEGLLLHMRGSWELIFDVFHGAKKTSFPFELEL